MGVRFVCKPDKQIGTAMARSDTIKSINQKRILQLLRRPEAVSSGRSGARAGLTRSTLTSIVNDLLRQGLVVESADPIEKDGCSAARSSWTTMPTLRHWARSISAATPRSSRCYTCCSQPASVAASSSTARSIARRDRHRRRSRANPCVGPTPPVCVRRAWLPGRLCGQDGAAGDLPASERQRG